MELRRKFPTLKRDLLGRERHLQCLRLFANELVGLRPLLQRFAFLLRVGFFGSALSRFLGVLGLLTLGGRLRRRDGLLFGVVALVLGFVFSYLGRGFLVPFSFPVVVFPFGFVPMIFLLFRLSFRSFSDRVSQVPRQ